MFGQLICKIFGHSAQDNILERMLVGATVKIPCERCGMEVFVQLTKSGPDFEYDIWESGFSDDPHD